MKTYNFGLPNSDEVITVTAENFNQAMRLFKEELRKRGIL